MIKIFYPYWAKASKWDELKYSLRSLEKNFKQDFEVWIVGDLPEWVKVSLECLEFGVPKVQEISNVQLQNSVAGCGLVHIPYTRDESKSSLWNTTRMMEVFLEKSSECLKLGVPKVENEDLFVRMYDDVYLLKSITSQNLMVNRIVRTEEEVLKITSGSSIWRKQVFSTYAELKEREYPGYMTESHCPELFSAKKMKLILQTFGLPGNDLLTSTLYQNVFPYGTSIIDKKSERALFYNEENDYSYMSINVASKCSGKRFLNHNDAGLNDELKRFIEQKFPEKSRWEK
jgi:hypothetical protein